MIYPEPRKESQSPLDSFMVGIIHSRVSIVAQAPESDDCKCAKTGFHWSGINLPGSPGAISLFSIHFTIQKPIATVTGKTKQQLGYLGTPFLEGHTPKPGPWDPPSLVAFYSAESPPPAR